MIFHFWNDDQFLGFAGSSCENSSNSSWFVSEEFRLFCSIVGWDGGISASADGGGGRRSSVVVFPLRVSMLTRGIVF